MACFGFFCRFGGDICFMGYIGSVGYYGFHRLCGFEYHIVFCSLDLYNPFAPCNPRNTFDPLTSLSQEKHYGAVYAPWAMKLNT